MGVYIKNMEMPKNCHECRLYEGDIYYCSAADKMIDISDSSAEKCQFCPLVEIPPHGRLGDLDALKETIEALIEKHLHGYTKSTWDFVCELRSIISNAPTIIEEER